MMAVGVGASELYRDWAGTPDFRQTEENLKNIQVGITTLQSKLETTESELATTKTQLKDAKADAEADSSAKQKTINELNDKVTALEKERTDTIALIKGELEDGIREVNGKNGPRHKYDAVKDIVNEWADKLGLVATDRLGDHGTSTEYNEKVEELEAKKQELEAKQKELNTKESELSESNSDLEQAVKDMETLKNQSEDVLKSLDSSEEE